MAEHALAFLDALDLRNCDVLGFSLGGMVAIQMVEQQPSIFQKMILIGTAPRGGDDVTGVLEKAADTLANILAGGVPLDHIYGLSDFRKGAAPE